MQESHDSKQDIWREWLLKKRFGGDPALMQDILEEHLYPVRNIVLENAKLQENDTLLDVGCGDGLIAFGALERFAGVRVIFSDVSQELLNHSRQLAQKMQVANRCRFVRAAAEDLAGIEDATVDVVTTRSVLIYVADKAKAFREFFRVLKQNGRISLFEPINRFSYPSPRHIFIGFDVTPIMEITDKLKSVYRAIQPIETDPMLDFDERDLFAQAEAAGFSEIDLELKLELRSSSDPRPWDAFLHSAGNPKIPTLIEAMDRALSLAEKNTFIAYLRPRYEAGEGSVKRAVATLWAAKI